MSASSDKIRLPNIQEFDALHKQDPETVLLPQSQQQFDDAREVVKQLDVVSKQFPLFQETEESLDILRLQMDMKRYQDEFIEKISDGSLKAVISIWLRSSDNYVRYAASFTKMFDLRIIPDLFADGKDFTLGMFKHIRHDVVLATIKKYEGVSETDRQEMCNSYSSFLSYLNKMTYGWLRLSGHKTTPKAIDKALSFSDWRTFIDVLFDFNNRDSIIARCILQGVKQVSEILALTAGQLDFEKNVIRFKEKSGDVEISYSPTFMQELKEYIETTADQRKDSNVVFVTKTGQPVMRSRLNHSFALASQRANVKKVTPELLRTMWVTFVNQGFKETAIMDNKKQRTERSKEQRIKEGYY